TALAAAGTAIIGGLPTLHILLVATPDTGDFTGLEAALASLRANPAVEFAAMDEKEDVSAVPRAAEDATSTPPHNWAWELTIGPGGQPLGYGGNWGLEASRFPQAWNLKEAISSLNHSIDTGIIDA